MDMTKEQRDKLRTLALAATPGEWYHVQAFQRLADERTIHGKVPGQRVDFVSTERKPVHKKIIIPMEGRESTARSEDMAYIAAANPATLLALLDRIDELEGDAEPHAILGWAHAYFCCALDDGIDPRKIEVPKIIAAMEKQLLAAAPGAGGES